MTEVTTAAEAVAQGAQLLDEKMPGWWRLISLEDLRMTDCDACICGQLALYSYDEVTRAEIRATSPVYCNKYTSYYRHFLAKELDLETDTQHGFSVPYSAKDGDYCFGWDELETEWKTAICARLEADKLAASQVEEAEVVHA